MREISTEMAALLKSGKQIGNNRPTAEVLIGGGGGVTLQDFTAIQVAANREPEETINYNGLDFIYRDDGKVLVTYCNNTPKVYLSVVDTPEDLILTVQAPKTNEWVFNPGFSFTPEYYESRFIRAANGDLLLFVSAWRKASNDYHYSLKVYKSANGLGTDFTLLSTLATEYNSTVLNFIGDVAKPIVTDTGRIIVPYKSYIGGVYNASALAMYYSDDNGVTWSTIGLSGVGLRDWFSYTVMQFSDALVAFAKNQIGGYDQMIMAKSTDDGSTWSTVVLDGDGYLDYIINAWFSGCGDVNIYHSGITVGGATFYTLPKTASSEMFLTVADLIDESKWQLLADTIYTNTQTMYAWEYETGKVAVGGTRAYDGRYASMLFAINWEPEALQAKSVTINRSKGMAGGLTVEFDNKSAILAPDGTANPQLLWPNKEVVVKQGYGAELLKTFTGLIDSISMSRDEQGVASVTVSARDKLKVALDHLIRNAEFLYTLTYTNMLVEDIWKNLVGLAGLTYNTVEATGLTISEKTFSWETYADAFSWLDEIAGFETYCDEEGLLNFVWDGRPSVITVAYEFSEGVDITRLGYEINDVDLYYTVSVYGKLPADPEVEGSTDSVIYFARQLPQATYWNIPPGKVLRIDAPDADTVAKCEIIADKAIYLMQTRARQVSFGTIGIPHLQRGDFIQVTEASSTISEIYRITDISTNQGPESYEMTLTCYYHAAPEVV